MGKTEKLSASLEDYIEAIYQIAAVGSGVHVKDVAERLSVAAPSVTSALRSLVRRGLVNHAPYEVITLTHRGRKLAKGVVLRHEVLTKFFTEVLAVEKTLAEDCACKMEHIVPDEVLERFIEFVKFEERCDLGGTEWIDGVGFVCNAHAAKGDLCESCSAENKVSVSKLEGVESEQW